MGLFGASRDKPRLLRFRSSPQFIVASVSFAVFTDLFLYAVIVPILPFTLTERIGIPEDQVQSWISYSLTIFAIALLVSSPIWGYMADHTQNRRVPMLGGLVLLTGASLLLCFSVTISMMVIGRILQGFSGSIIWSVGLAMVIDSVDRNKIGEATGWIGSSMSLALLVGPFFGGIIYGKLGYYAVFVACFALIGVDIAMRLSIIEVKTAKLWVESDSDCEAPTESDRLLPANNGAANGTAAAETQSASSSLKESHMSILQLLSKPRLLAALWGTIVEASINTSFDSTLPLLVSTTFDWDSVGTGMIFLPVALPSFLGPVIGALGDRYGPKWLASGGFIAMAPLLVCLQFVTENTLAHQVLLCSLLGLIGICLAFIIGPLMAEITWSIQEESVNFDIVPYAMAYAMYNSAFSVGAIIGPILGGIIRDRVGMWAVGLAFGSMTVFTSGVCALVTGGPLRRRRTSVAAVSE